MPTREWKLWVPQVRTRFIAKRCGDERSVISEQVLDMEQSSEDIGQDIWTKSCRDYNETDCPCDVCAGWRKKREDSYWSHQYHDNYDEAYYEDDDDYRSYEDILQDKLRDRDDKVAELEHEVRNLLWQNSLLRKELKRVTPACGYPEDWARHADELEWGKIEKAEWLNGDDLDWDLVHPAFPTPEPSGPQIIYLHKSRPHEDGEMIRVA